MASIVLGSVMKKCFFFIVSFLAESRKAFVRSRVGGCECIIKGIDEFFDIMLDDMFLGSLERVGVHKMNFFEVDN